MLRRLRIKNFKAWRDTGDIELAPLTVFFGVNSSGKSSLQQFLLMLRQTVESPDRKRVLHTGDDRTAVDLGSYSELVHDGNAAERLEFELGWKRQRPLNLEYPRTGEMFSGCDLDFRSILAATGDGPVRPQVEEYEYTLHTEVGAKLALCSRRTVRDQFTLEAEGIELVRTLGRKWPVSPPSQFHAFPDDLPTRYQSLEFAADLTLALEEQLSMISYLGPIRSRPTRLYRWSGEETSGVGTDGQQTIEALLSGRNRRYNFRPREHTKPLQVLVAEWLKRLEVIEQFRVTPIGEGRDEYEVRVRTPGNRHEVLLTDVGFGVSQVLPVIVESFYPEPGSTVIIEQPEIHLHPAVQSGLADLFLDAIKAREAGAERKTQFLIESHSEHLLRRLLLRIAEHPNLLDLVKCYVVDRGRDGSRIHPLEVDPQGNVHNWPNDFFGNPAADIIAQTRAARRQRQSAESSR